MDKEKEKKEEFILKIKVLVGIIILIIIFYFINLKKEKKKELNEVKAKLEENEKLNAAIQKRKKIYFSCIRWGVVLLYLGINIFEYKFHTVALDVLLNVNAVFFISVSALTFARFGSFDSYHKWWHFLEIRAEVLIYKKSPELKQIIAEQQEYKKNLEKEIDQLDLFFNSINQPQEK